MMTNEWNRETIPQEGAIVYVLAVDDLGPYEVPFPVLFLNGWLNASTHQELDAIVAAWRPGEFRSLRATSKKQPCGTESPGSHALADHARFFRS